MTDINLNIPNALQAADEFYAASSAMQSACEDAMNYIQQQSAFLQGDGQDQAMTQYNQLHAQNDALALELKTASAALTQMVDLLHSADVASAAGFHL
jgi:uncharacterized protein YukE